VGTRIPTGILLVAGLVLLVIWPSEWIIAGLLINTVGGIRIYDLRRGRLKFVPWPLTIIALIMPRPAAYSYLEDLGHSANEVQGQERRRHIWHAVVASPATLITVWRVWLRARLVELILWVLFHRVHQARRLIQDVAPGSRQYRVALRRLRRYCRLITLTSGSGQYHEYVGPARALLLSCRQSAEKGGDADLDARIWQELEELARALASRRPDRA
jgi:hypothetical protein